MSWALLHCHSDASLLDGLSKPQNIIKRCVDVGITAAAITDHGSLGNSFGFIKAKKSVIGDYKKFLEKATTQEDKDKWTDKIDKATTLKQILGCELYLCPQDPSIFSKENGKHSHLVTLCKNKEGWKAMLKLTAEANRPENFYRKARTSLDRIAKYANGNLIAFSGHMGSDLANCLFVDINAAYNAKTYDEAKALLDPNWKKKAFDLVGKYIEVFGKENFFIEIQRIDEVNLPAARVVAEALRFIAKKCGQPCVATADSHYTTRQSAGDQRVLLCSLEKTTLQYVMQEIEKDDSDVGLAAFFRSDNYHIPTPGEIAALHTEEEMVNSMLIASMCEDYSIMAKPSVPKYPCPDGLSSDDYLRNLCRDGFKNRTKGRIPEGFTESMYIDRIKEELAVWSKTGILSDYFLIVQDYVNWARNHGRYVGPSRGSGGGCLTNYWLGITGMDPLFYDLSFARFYNDGRNTADRTSLPDVDSDFANPGEVVEYVQKRWGVANVCRMGTFSRMMGRSVLKDVLRVHGAASAEEQNRITEFIPDEAAIADQLQEMRNEGVEPSIIKWALKDNAKELKEWCHVDEKGKLQGPLAKYFAQAIRLEGTKRGMGKHASGVIIADFTLDERFPMVRDKSSDNLLTGIPMEDVEDGGGAKFDILGVQCLARVSGAAALLAGKRIVVNKGDFDD